MFWLLTVLALLTGCAWGGGTPIPTVTPSSPPTATPAPLSTRISTSTATPAPTASRTPTPTLTSTPGLTPSLSGSGIKVTVKEQAHCRYGPGTAYLHAADLFAGEKGIVDGRNGSGTWLWIQPDKLERHCWAAASVLTLEGEASSLPVVTSNLPYSNLYGPPQNVQSARDGDQVAIAWDRLPFTQDDDRGYMLQLTLCQGGRLVSETIHTDETMVTVTDEQDCGGGAGGTLWGVEKHGYTQSVEIPWP